MIEVKIVEDKAKADKLCKSVGITPCAAHSVMAADDRGEVLAFSVFRIERNEMMFERLSPEDDALMADAIIRSTLHVAANRGILKVYYGAAVSEKLLSVLGFIEDKELKTLNISKLFEDSCGGCK